MIKSEKRDLDSGGKGGYVYVYVCMCVYMYICVVHMYAQRGQVHVSPNAPTSPSFNS